MKFPNPFVSEATAELLDAVAWYETEQPDLGKRFLNAVDQALRTGVPLTFPELGPTYPYRRYLVTGFPYLLVVRLQEPELPLVLAVAHESRRPGYWLSRETPPVKPRSRRRKR